MGLWTEALTLVTVENWGSGKSIGCDALPSGAKTEYITKMPRTGSGYTRKLSICKLHTITMPYKLTILHLIKGCSGILKVWYIRWIHGGWALPCTAAYVYPSGIKLFLAIYAYQDIKTTLDPAGLRRKNDASVACLMVDRAGVGVFISCGCGLRTSLARLGINPRKIWEHAENLKRFCVILLFRICSYV